MPTPTPDDAIAYAKRFLGQMVVDATAIKLRLLDDAHKKLWMAAPWSWTLGSLEVVTLVNDTQDISLTGTYTDIFGLVYAQMVAASGEPTELQIATILPSTTIIKGRPTKVQYIPSTPKKLRFSPVPTGFATLPVTSIPKVLVTYKKTAAAIDSTSTAAAYSALGVPDEWFWVYQEIVLLKAFQFAHDPRLGSVQVGPNGMVFTGQFAAVETAIAEMRRNEEKLYGNLGEVVNA